MKATKEISSKQGTFIPEKFLIAALLNLFPWLQKHFPISKVSKVKTSKMDDELLAKVVEPENVRRKLFLIPYYEWRPSAEVLIFTRDGARLGQVGWRYSQAHEKEVAVEESIVDAVNRIRSHGNQPHYVAGILSEKGGSCLMIGVVPDAEVLGGFQERCLKRATDKLKDGLGITPPAA